LLQSSDVLVGVEADDVGSRDLDLLECAETGEVLPRHVLPQRRRQRLRGIGFFTPIVHLRYQWRDEIRRVTRVVGLVPNIPMRENIHITIRTE
jgi:hypothetical protein